MYTKLRNNAAVHVKVHRKAPATPVLGVAGSLETRPTPSVAELSMTMTLSSDELLLGGSWRVFATRIANVVNHEVHPGRETVATCSRVVTIVGTATCLYRRCCNA